MKALFYWFNGYRVPTLLQSWTWLQLLTSGKLSFQEVSLFFWESECAQNRILQVLFFFCVLFLQLVYLKNLWEPCYFRISNLFREEEMTSKWCNFLTVFCHSHYLLPLMFPCKYERICSKFFLAYQNMSRVSDRRSWAFLFLCQRSHLSKVDLFVASCNLVNSSVANEDWSWTSQERRVCPCSYARPCMALPRGIYFDETFSPCKQKMPFLVGLDLGCLKGYVWGHYIKNCSTLFRLAQAELALSHFFLVVCSIWETIKPSLSTFCVSLLEFKWHAGIFKKHTIWVSI